MRNAYNADVARALPAHCAQAHQPKNLPKFLIEFDKCSIFMTADSAATCNILDEETFLSNFDMKLDECSDKLNAYGGTSISTVGKFASRVKCGEFSITDTFYVTKGKFGNLLGVDASRKLGHLKVANHAVQTVSSEDMQKYPSIFTGIGQLKDFKVHLHIDKSVPPAS
ncbi:uncharacterized protein LOC141914578 [Tubulanus polymorphus]|uniref:uncharacterized protein LOC141914578 n=1 Tax=Tubulanus polymorphus TaxID=672921 RepID=UPI003DA27060